MKPALPRVTLQMIAYNHAKYIPVALWSVMRQTYPNWELIVVDDNSTDGTWDIIRDAASKDVRIRHYRNSVNLGTPNNRAEAMRHTTGEFIAHVDSDDFLYPNAIQAMVEALVTNPSAVLGYSDYAILNSHGKLTSYVANPDPSADLSGHGWKHFGMYRRSAYDRTQGYNRALVSCEDGDLFMQLVENAPYVRVPQILYAHRHHDTNTSSRNKHCKDCDKRPVCNYMRVWSKHAKFDPVTFTPLSNAK